MKSDRICKTRAGVFESALGICAVEFPRQEGVKGVRKSCCGLAI